jgi:hypothetical protein
VDPVLRRRIAVLLLIAGIAVGALAIADVGPFEDPLTEEERVESTVEEFFAAAERGNGKAFCGLLTRDARQTLQINTAQRLQTDEPPSCAKLMKTLQPVFKGSSIDVRFVNVSGNQARVEARYKLKGAAAQPRTILLRTENGEWRISEPG